MNRAGKDSFKNEDYYRHYLCVKPMGKEYGIDRKTFVSILNDVFEGLFNVIVQEGSIDLPFRTGSLFLRRIETKPRLVDGEIRYVAPIDWASTKKLWAEDALARESKILVKFPPGEVYQIKYLTNFALHRKTKYYTFRLMRSIKRGKLKELAKYKHNGMKWMNANK